MPGPYRDGVPLPKTGSSKELAKFAREIRAARRRDLLVGLGKRLLLGGAILAGNALVLALTLGLGLPPVLTLLVTSTIGALVWTAVWALTRSRRRA